MIFVRLCVSTLVIYTVYINIICDSQEGLTFIESDHQINDIYKWVIFEKEKKKDVLYLLHKVNFWCIWFIHSTI